MIVITGATGNIGRKIATALLARGRNVRCIARTAEDLLEFSDQGADVAAISLAQTDLLTQAFSGAEAVFAMIPPNYEAPDFLAYQEMIGTSLATAIKDADVPYVVNLSSLGAHLPDLTGPIKGLHAQEKRLNRLFDAHVLHLRPTYFMENLLVNADLIKNMNIMGSAIRNDIELPMIATADIAAYAVERLDKKDFPRQSIVHLLGQRDLSMDEAALIIGRKIDMPGLKYVQFPYDETQRALINKGFSQDVAGLFVEMSKAFNDGLIQAQRTADNSTQTSMEEFATVFRSLVYESSK